MRVVLARHGESVANVERVISNRDLPHGLTALGRRQAGELVALPLVAVGPPGCVRVDEGPPSR